mmetsp:Transcript_23124/g.57023  ORF Transcript_23124/g.57023 Transcript_23124/m.57023 type:complete len:348 (-) Transcript_23124:378-1421(-)
MEEPAAAHAEPAAAPPGAGGVQGHGGFGAGEFAEWAATRLSLKLDLHVPLPVKARVVVEAQRAAMSRDWMMYAGGAATLLLLASMGKGRSTVSKLISLGLSFMWASQGLIVLGEVVSKSGPGNPWPVEGVVTALLFGGQSVLNVIFGTSNFLQFGQPIARIKSSISQQMGLVLLLLSFVQTAVHLLSKGVFFKMPFPVDVFTLGLFFASAVDSGYSKMMLYIPVICTVSRTGVESGVLEEMENLAVLFAGLLAFHISQSWGMSRDAYKWTAPGAAQGSGQQREKVVKPRRMPLMQETHQGNGGVQGFAAVDKMKMVDEDGDEAMEFFEVTDEGLKKRNPSVHPQAVD